MPTSPIIPLTYIGSHRNEGIVRYRAKIVASGILIHQGKVLLVKRGKQNYPDPDTWTLPCGHLWKNENAEQAATREFFEETGIKVCAKKFISTEYYFYDRSSTRNLIIEFLYFVQPVHKKFKIKLDNENQSYAFVKSIDLKKYGSLVNPRQKAVTRAFKVYAHLTQNR